MRITLLIKALIKAREMRKKDSWSREKLLSFRNKKLEEIRKYAYGHSSFYKEFHKGLFNASISDLPVLAKTQMMQRFDDLITDRKLRIQEIKDFITNNKNQLNYKSNYWINTTSGSTGSPGIFVFNNDEWSQIMAAFLRMQEFAGYKVNLFNPPKRAVVSSLKMTHMSSLVSKTVGDFLMPMLHMDATEKPEDIVRKLNEFQPHTLVGYASMIHILAQERLKQTLKISPEIIFSSSEVLTNDMRKKIEKAFGKKLFNEYASTEAGSIGGECQYHTGLHLLEDNVYVEVVDRDNHPVPEGAFGDKLLITPLFNRTQPLIRYELSDSIKLSSKSCPCGRPHILIEDIQGRTEDFLYFDSPEKKITIHPNKIQEIMEFVPVTSWQIVLERNKISIFLVGLNPNYNKEMISTGFNNLFMKEGVRGITTEIEEISSIPKSASGKAPLIKNLNLKK